MPSYVCKPQVEVRFGDIWNSVLKHVGEIEKLLRGDPEVESPIPGVNVPAQVVIHVTGQGEYCHVLRAVLPKHTKDPILFDVLSLRLEYDLKTYLHHTTVFFQLPESPLQ